METLLVTGADGYVGNLFLQKCAAKLGKDFNKIIGLDIRVPRNRVEGVDYVQVDIRSEEVHQIIKKENVSIVIHLAAILSSADNSDRNFEYDVDVNGSKNILDACIKLGVKKFIFTSSGASYGYHERNIDYLLREEDELKGNPEVPYAYHKMLVEQHLADLRKSNPELQQYIFRVGTIIGKKTDNLITDLFKKKKLLALKGYDSSFCMIWDEDLAEILLKACLDGNPGIYNVAGNGAMTMKEMSQILQKPLKELPAKVLKGAFKVLHPLKLSKHGPIAISFLQYRPVLDNEKLKSNFGYQPKKSSKEAFEYFLSNNNIKGA